MIKRLKTTCTGLALTCIATSLLIPRPSQAAEVPEPQVELKIPANQRLINGTGQIPILGSVFKAPGFTSQGYIQVCADAGPHLCFVGLNSSDVPLTIRNTYKTTYNGPLTHITYANRNAALGLKNSAEETVAQPWQFYVSDPMPLTVKAGDELYLRTFIPLEKDTNIGCGIISGSMSRPDGRWPYGNVTSAEDLTMDPDLESRWKPTSDFLYVPFLLAGENVKPGTPFIVAFGDSLTFQLEKDKGGTWFQNSFADTPHANLAIGGDALGNVLTADGKLTSPLQAARFAIAHYATDVINFYGHNDMGNGRTMVDMLNLDAKFCARPEIARARKWRVTQTPFTRYPKGTDIAKLTEADQTPDQYSPVLIAYNKEVRANFRKYGYDGVLDIGALLANGPDSPYWQPGMAGDGTHFGRNPPNALIAPLVRKILPAPAAPTAVK